MKSEALERRRHPRVPAWIPVRISTIEPEQDPWTGRPFFRAAQETCANLSRGGAFVRTGEPIDPGRRVLIELHLPDGGQLEAIGRVAWSRRTIEPAESRIESGVGVEFLGGAAEQFSALDDYLNRTEERIPA